MITVTISLTMLQHVGVALFWAIVVPASAGLLIGFFFRVPSLLAASAITALAAVAVTPASSGWLLAVLANGLGMVLALQVGYLAGLFVACALSRVKDQEDRRSLEHDG